MVSARKQLNTKLTMIDKLNYLPLRSHAQENTFHSADQKTIDGLQMRVGLLRALDSQVPCKFKQSYVTFDDQVKKKKAKKKTIIQRATATLKCQWHLFKRRQKSSIKSVHLCQFLDFKSAKPTLSLLDLQGSRFT